MKTRLFPWAIFFILVIMHGVPLAFACCKVCSTSRACGNGCIAASYTCHQPPGCACNGSGGSSSQNNHSSSKPKTPKARYGVTSGALELPFNFMNFSAVTCGYANVNGLISWVPGEYLQSGKFLPLVTKIRNLTYLARFYSGSKSASYTKAKNKVKATLRKTAPICARLALP